MSFTTKAIKTSKIHQLWHQKMTQTHLAISSFFKSTTTPASLLKLLTTKLFRLFCRKPTNPLHTSPINELRLA